MQNDQSHAGPRHGAKAIAIIIAVALLASMAACSTKKSESQLAADALAAGLTAQKAGDMATAAADYRQVLVHDPKNQFAYYNLGLIDQTNNSMASADSNYSLALSIDPNFESALYNLAIVKTAESDSTSAIQLYQQVIKLDPKNAAAHLNLGFALINDGQKGPGKGELAKAVSLDPTLASRIPSDPGQPSSGPSAQPGSPQSSASP